MDILETMKRVTADRKKQKDEILIRLRAITQGDEKIDECVYKELVFFLYLGADVDLDLIASCICDFGYYEDFIISRRYHSALVPYLPRFESLIFNLKSFLM